MAVKTNNVSSIPAVKTKVSRKGVHSKTKSSSSKTAKLYKKTYKGQG
jgi:hypothetical protein